MDQTPLENEPTHMITPVDHIYYVWWMVAIRIVCNVGISHLQFGKEASIICFIQYRCSEYTITTNLLGWFPKIAKSAFLLRPFFLQNYQQQDTKLLSTLIGKSLLFHVCKSR